MTRCELLYKKFQKIKSSCGKSEAVTKSIEDYIDYVRRNKLKDFGEFKLNHCAMLPLMSIEEMKYGKVHRVALAELKRLIRRKKYSPERITRRLVVELINRANNEVEISFKIDHIPGIRSRMGDFEHAIEGVSRDIHDTFISLKRVSDMGTNNTALTVLLELGIRHVDELGVIKGEMESGIEKDKNSGVRIVEMVKN